MFACTWMHTCSFYFGFKAVFNVSREALDRLVCASHINPARMRLCMMRFKLGHRFPFTAAVSVPRNIQFLQRALRFPPSCLHQLAIESSTTDPFRRSACCTNYISMKVWLWILVFVEKHYQPSWSKRDFVCGATFENATAHQTSTISDGCCWLLHRRSLSLKVCARLPEGLFDPLFLLNLDDLAKWITFWGVDSSALHVHF